MTANNPPENPARPGGVYVVVHVGNDKTEVRTFWARLPAFSHANDVRFRSISTAWVAEKLFETEGIWEWRNPELCESVGIYFRIPF